MARTPFIGAAILLALALGGCAPGSGGGPSGVVSPVAAAAVGVEPLGHAQTGESGGGYPDVELIEDQDAARFLQLYQTYARRTLEQAIERRKFHLPVVAEEFSRAGVPLELSNVAIIESGFDPSQRGKGVAGLWQFTVQTAKSYGLIVTKKIDQRMDVRRSSAAAARHLADLYREYRDWYLVLAAYNCGKGRLEKGMRKTGERDYFRIKRERGLSKTTGDFVPRFMAITEILRDPVRFGFVLERN